MGLALNNRELAIVLWLTAGLLWALTQRDIRTGLFAVITTVLHPKVLVPLAAMAGYVVGLVAVGKAAGLWDSDLVNDAVVWFITVALVLYVNLNRVSDGSHFLRSALAQAVGLMVLVEGFVNLYVFPLWVELVVFPVVCFIVAIAAVAETHRDHVVVAKLANQLLSIFGTVLVLFVLIHLLSGWGTVDWAHVGRALFLPVWLTAGVLPFIFLAGLYAAYESTFVRLDFFGEKLGRSRRAQRRAKAALLLGTGFRARYIGDFVGPWPQRLASATSFSMARRVVKDFLAPKPVILSRLTTFED